MSISKESLDEVALSEAEFGLIVSKLEREPTEVELGMFGSLWSEHCGYKHSKHLLKLLPSKGKRVVVGPGGENAGAVDIGDGQVAVVKMESHNHPSAIEPYHGAATAVGGVIRDIFTMGARPVALLSSLRFGPLDEPRNRYLLREVAKGIADYGNGVDIPGVGGELFFANCYSGNPLVNGLCLGIADKDKMIRARASGVGNVLMLVGAATGRDGIHGASGLASRDFGDGKELEPVIPVGDPSLEKRLIEACLGLAGTDWIVGMQDLGAAGLTSSAVETAAKGGGGVELDVLKVPRCEDNMSPYEVMLSESQERMLVIVKKGCEERVKSLCDSWDVACHVVGKVTDTGLAVIREGDTVVAQAPVDLLVSPPLYRRRSKKPNWLEELEAFDVEALPDIKPRKCNSVLLRLLASPNIGSKEYIFDQCDKRSMADCVLPQGNDAAVLRVKGTQKGISLAADGNGRYCYLDPYVGAAIAVAEAARNVVCSGAEPLALTDCLNFGDPEKGDAYYQLKRGIEGIARACKGLRIPVISGNVSLYNETGGRAIYPTPVIGMVGLLSDVDRHSTSSFKNEGDLVFLLGGGVGNGLGGSEYLELVHGLVVGQPEIDLDLERRVQRCCLDAIGMGIVRSAHDCSDGGLAVAIAVGCIAGDIGFRGRNWKVRGRLDSALFGEIQSRIVLSVQAESVRKLERLAARWKVTLGLLGTVGGRRLMVEDYIDLPLAKMGKAWRSGLGHLLET